MIFKNIYLILIFSLSFSAFASADFLNKVSQESDTKFYCTNIYDLIRTGDAEEVDGGVILHSPEKAYQIVAKDIGSITGALLFKVYMFEKDELVFLSKVNKEDLTDPANHPNGEWMEDWELEFSEENADSYSNGGSSENSVSVWLDTYTLSDNNLLSGNAWIFGKNVPIVCEMLNL